MKVLVTGGCGFLGSHVCELFLRRGWEVVSFDNMTKSELVRTGYQADAARDHNWNLLDGIGVEMVRADIRDLEALMDSASACDYIVHTAAQPAVTISLEDPLLDLSTNVTGTVHVLETARRHDIPVGSCATVHVYGNWVNEQLSETETRYVREPAEIAEDEPTMRGYLTPLHGSKASAEHYVTVYASAYGLRAASFRLTGIYGPRQLGGEDHGWVANFSRSAMCFDWPDHPIRDGQAGARHPLRHRRGRSAFMAFFERGQAPASTTWEEARTSAISLLECIDLIDECTSESRKTEVRFEDVALRRSQVLRLRHRGACARPARLADRSIEAQRRGFLS